MSSIQLRKFCKYFKELHVPFVTCHSCIQTELW